MTQRRTEMSNDLMAVIFTRKMLALLLLGFAAGIPLALTTSTLQAWLTSEGVDIKTIGLFSLVGIPYAFKYVWSPFMDRYVPPFLGRRRGWILIAQFVLMGVIASMGMLDPQQSTTLIAVVAVMVAFFSASQDIVVDAYRTDVTEGAERGPSASLFIFGYRIAMLTSGAGALILSDNVPWRVVFLIMAACMSVGVAATFLAPEPRVAVAPPPSLAASVVQPFVEYFRRRGAIEILLFILFYKMTDVFATALSTTFMLQIGFTRTDIGAVTKGFGLVATILGTLFGGVLMVKLGLKGSLWLFGILQGLSNLAYAGLAMVGHHFGAMATAIGIDNLCGGMGTAAYTAFMMSLCNKRFTATQYALLTSLMALTRTIAISPAGYVVESIGWVPYFLVSLVFQVPALLLLTRYDRWTRVDGDEVEDARQRLAAGER